MSYFPMFPLAFKKHSAQVSSFICRNPPYLQLQPWQKQSDCIIILYGNCIIILSLLLRLTLF